MEKELFYYMGGFSRIARRIPTAMNELISDIEGHRLRFGIEHRLTPTLKQDIQRIESRRVRAAFVITFMVCGTLAIPHLPKVLLGLPALTLGAYLLAGLGFLSLYLGYPRIRE